jgi:hypothetical protein
MAITATVDLGNGVSKASCYIIVPTAYVKKFISVDGNNTATFKLIYDVHIYQDKEARDHVDRLGKHIRCPEVDRFKIDYDPTTSDNPFKLAYTHLKSNSKLSSVADA